MTLRSPGETSGRFRRPRRLRCATLRRLRFAHAFRYAGFAAFLGAALLSAACGIQGPVTPPRLEYPQQIKDLVATQVGRTWELTFTLPKLATDGQSLTKPLEIELARSVTAPGSTPAAPATPWVTLTAPQVAAAARQGKFHYLLPLSEQEFGKQLGWTFSFAARGQTRRFRGRLSEGAWSKPAVAALLDVSAPLEHLQVRPSEKALQISWAAPARSLSGGPLPPLAGYRLYRSTTGAAGSFRLRAQPSGTHFDDTGFRFGQHYYYKVRAAFRRAGTTAESADSPVVEVTPRDVFPPAAPRHLSALYAAGSVEVIWTANTDADLAGYNVYRRQAGESFRKLNPQLLPTPIFRDRSVEPGRTYEYRVTAVDLAGNESAPSTVAKVETR